MKSFDLISDIHLDFWVSGNVCERNDLARVDAFVDSLLPPTPSKTLVIAGDLGHYNDQNEILLRSFRRHYEYVVFVFGNHDFYLVSSKERYRYQNRSSARWTDMKSRALAIEVGNVVPLDGTSVTIDDVVFAGSGMWYDYAYGIIEKGLSRGYLHEIWEDTMNDEIYIKAFRPQVRSADEISKLESVFDSADVILTHIPPDWSQLPKEVSTSFYSFDGSRFLDNDRARGKVWCFGHVHERLAYTKNGCFLLNNAVGYPEENLGTRIRTVRL